MPWKMILVVILSLISIVSIDHATASQLVCETTFRGQPVQSIQCDEKEFKSFCETSEHSYLLEYYNGNVEECIEKQRIGAITYKKILDSQDYNELSKCAGYVTGHRARGVFDFLDNHLQANCLNNKDADSIFNDCVWRVTGRNFNGSRLHWLEDAYRALEKDDFQFFSNAIASCANFYFSTENRNRGEWEPPKLKQISRTNPKQEDVLYDGCTNTAQSYQDLYEKKGMAKDLVCMQRALERELNN